MQVPLTAVLLLFELTHDYFIILPTLGAVGISYWVAYLPALRTANGAGPNLHAAAGLVQTRAYPVEEHFLGLLPSESSMLN